MSKLEWKPLTRKRGGLMSKAQRFSLAAILAGAIGAPAGVPAPIFREVLPMTPAPARLPIEGNSPSLGK